MYIRNKARNSRLGLGLILPVGFLMTVAVAWVAAQSSKSAPPIGDLGPTINLSIHEGTMIAIGLSHDKQNIVMDLQGSLFTLPATGGQAKMITDELYDARQPDWSPDGSKIAFQSNRNGLIHIWTINRDGTGAREITKGDFEDREPSWSPDGKRIAFSSDRSGAYAVWYLDVDSGAMHQVTKNSANEFAPTWSPTGQEIAFVSSRQSGPGVYAIRPDGSAEHQMAAVAGATSGFGRANVGSPAWSPDGKKVLYTVVANQQASLMLNDQKVVTGEDVFPFRAQWVSPTEFIYVANGKIQRRSLTASAGTPIAFTANLRVRQANYARKPRDFSSLAPRKALGIVRPVISPNGKQVAFVAVGDVWIMDIGSKPKRLTNDTSAKTDPAWSPDGSKLVYSSDRSGSFNLWMRDLKTGAEKQVTDKANAEYAASFSPDGSKVAFVDATGDMDGAVNVLDVKTGRAKEVFAASFGPGYPTWSADGHIIIISGLKKDSTRFREGSNQMLAISAEGGDPGRMIVPVDHKSIGSRLGEGPAWSPDGSLMAFGMQNSLYIMPVNKTGDPTGPPKLLVNDPVDYLNWTGDSKHVFYLSVDRMKMVSVPDGKVQDIPLDLTWTEDVPKGRVVVHAGKLVDGVHQEERSNVDIVIEGNRIRSIEPHRANQTGKLVDASNQTVMPGLIEAHGHYINTNGSLYGRILLAYGITTVRSPAGKPPEIIEQREAFESGRRLGPRVYLAGHLLEGPRLYYPLAVSVNTPEEVDEQIDRSKRLEYDLVKAYVKLPEPLRERVVAQAHRAGIAVSSHELYPAALFGMDSVEHLTGTAGRGYVTKVSSLGYSYQDVLEILSKSKMTMTPTASLGGFYPDVMASDPGAFDDPRWRIQPASVRDVPENRRRGGGASKGQLAAILAMEKAGVRIIAGTDAPLVPYGLALHNDLYLEQKAGLTPFQVLQTATVNTAALLNATADLGSIEVGKLADMVVVDGDPLADIRNARKVKLVIKNGEVVEMRDVLNPANRTTAGAAGSK